MLCIFGAKHKTQKSFQHLNMVDLAKAIYAYPGAGQPTDLVFAAGTVLLVNEKSEDWCRGVCQGKEGWFPTAYSQALDCKFLEQVSLPSPPSPGTQPICKGYFIIIILEEAVLVMH